MSEMMIRRRLRQSADTRTKFKCGYCAQKFTLQSNLAYHELIHQLNQHEKIDELCECLCCRTRVERKTKVDQNGELKTCSHSHCGKKYGIADNLQRHERIHEWMESLEENEYECNDSALIFQSDDVNEPTLPDSATQIQSENNASTSKGNSQNLTDLENITIFISSDSDSSVDDRPSPIQDLNRDKESVRCSQCNLKFEQSDEKLKHQCQFPKPVTGAVAETTENAVAMNDAVATKITTAKESKKNKKDTTTKRRGRPRKENKAANLNRGKMVKKGGKAKDKTKAAKTKVTGRQRQSTMNEPLIELIIETNPNVIEPSNQSEFDIELNTSQVAIEPIESEIAEINNVEPNMEINSSNDIEINDGKCSKQNIQDEDIGDWHSIDLDLNVESNKRKRSENNTERSDTDGLQKSLSTNPPATIQQTNKNLSIVNVVHLDLIDVSSPKPAVPKSNENVQLPGAMSSTTGFCKRKFLRLDD